MTAATATWVMPRASTTRSLRRVSTSSPSDDEPGRRHLDAAVRDRRYRADADSVSVPDADPDGDAGPDADADARPDATPTPSPTPTLAPCTIPVASFTYTSSNKTFKFTDTSTVAFPSRCGIQTWDWDFGESGNHSNAQNPTYTYQASKSHTVTLTVTNSAGSDSYTAQPMNHRSDTTVPNTDSRRSGSGQMIVLFAGALTAIILIVGLVIDGGNAFAQRRGVQNSSDFGALAGARIVAEWVGGDTNNGTDANVRLAIQNALTANNASTTFGCPNGPSM